MSRQCDIDHETLRCRSCGAWVSSPSVVRICGPRPAAAGDIPQHIRGLGDYIAAGLSAVGITKELVSRAIGRPCSCAERQAALNQMGHKYLGLPTGTRG